MKADLQRWRENVSDASGFRVYTNKCSVSSQKGQNVEELTCFYARLGKN